MLRTGNRIYFIASGNRLRRSPSSYKLLRFFEPAAAAYAAPSVK